jgi:EAL domain-containing protein (putative c-di-GMP-specific phosphodiesterase class I)
VAAVIDMAKALGISSIAEGTESEDQMRILKGLGADMAQGFVVSKPLSSAEIEAALIATARV